ncbi:hypothetical protein MK280_04290, partial [Myxococcota bacterium]|nr:hypothetical protein [Myxococcota bacterium]
RMAERAFVLAPLNELAPDLKPPGSDRTVAELLLACAVVPGELRPWSGIARWPTVGLAEPLSTPPVGAGDN